MLHPRLISYVRALGVHAPAIVSSKARAWLLVPPCTAVLLLPIVSPSPAVGALLVPSEYTTIQEALDAAVNGDTVLVAPGTYSGPGNRDLGVDAGVVLLSQAGAGATIIDCDGTALDPHRGFRVAGHVEGFTVRNGYSPEEVMDPASGHGGGAFLSGPTSRVVGCIFEFCEATERGGGIAARFTSQYRIENCIIRDCVAPNGGGLFFWEGQPRIDECEIRNCTAQFLGGAVYCVGVGLGGYIRNSLIESNESGGGGGFFLELCGDLTIENTTFRGNAAAQGGGISLFEPDGITFDTCLIYGNSASSDGGGIDISSSFETNILNSTVTANSAGRGGGYYGHHGSSLWENSVLTGNCAATVGQDGWLETTLTDATFDCCGLDPAEVQGVGTLNFSGTVAGNPQFCGAVECTSNPTTAGDYSLRDDSPYLPAANACGVLIGALGEACTVAGAPPVVIDVSTVFVAPNPTSRGCVVEFRHPLPRSATVGIFDATGRAVAELVPVDDEATQRVHWDGRDRDGHAVPAGLYWARVTASVGIANPQSSGRIVILR